MNITNKVLLITCIAIISACTSSPTQNNEQKIINSEPAKNKVVKQEQSELQIIAENFSQTKDIQQLNLSLLNLANQAIELEQCNRANIIIKHIQPSLSLDLMHIANLFKAECNLKQLDYLDELASKGPLVKQTEEWLANINNQVLSFYSERIENSNLTERKVIALAKINAISGNHEVAINQFLSLPSSENYLARTEYSNLLWKWFSLTEQESRTALVNRFPYLSSYKILIDTIEDNSINDVTRKAILNKWLQDKVNNNDLELLPEQITQFIKFNSDGSQKIAVLLPLTGRLSSQGEAIKQGLLTAYLEKVQQAKENNNQYDTSIDFIDTGSFDTLKSSVSNEMLASYDTIIGPLLRSHVNAINSMKLSNTKKLLLNKNSILNSSDINVRNLVGTFSLSPEQEAAQIVALMRDQNILNPVLISDNASISKRMVDAFMKSWASSKLNDTNYFAPQIITYEDNKGMRVGITSALDVLQSQRRIKQLTNLTQDRLISVTRNRRDVDAFVVFARPDDVELINPIIESSISLFSEKQLPVFASSYSYDHKQNKNSQRDLRNLIFIDMPWLLPSGRETQLSNQVDILFNQPPSTFLRLFAFGYDSLSIADNLAKLTTFDHMNHQGLSGILSANEQNELIRQLDYIQISGN